MENVSYENRVRTATIAALQELSLSEAITAIQVQWIAGSSRYEVTLTEQSGFHTFYLNSVEAARGGYRDNESLKELAKRELLKIFPDPATR